MERRVAVTFQVQVRAMADQLPHYVGVAGVYGGHERASQPCGVVVFLYTRPALEQNVDDLAVPLRQAICSAVPLVGSSVSLRSRFRGDWCNISASDSVTLSIVG